MQTIFFFGKILVCLQLLALDVSADLRCAELAVSHLWKPEEPLAFYKTIREDVRDHTSNIQLN